MAASERVTAISNALASTPVSVTDAKRPASEGGIPAEPGFYAWWATRGSIPDVPAVPHSAQPLTLFYVGIAPRDRDSAQTLRTRVLDNHVSGNTGSSTFRLTLAALLLERLDLHPEKRKKKVVLPSDENKLLSKWQREHLWLTWATSEDPWLLETQVIGALAPPLNLAENDKHPFHSVLSKRREDFRRAADPATRER